MKISVVIPIHNEGETIQEIVQRVLDVPLEMELILVNDGSTDGSDQILDELDDKRIAVYHLPRNQGKGAAVRHGIKMAGGDVVAIQDADLEYDPSDLTALCDPIQSGKADVVYGVRDLSGQKWLLRWGNRFLSLMASVFYGQRLHDMETCYKLIRREIIQGIPLECSGFDIEPEITAKILRSGHRIFELPINYNPRYENKKLTPWDGIPAIKAILRYSRWRPEKS